VAIRAVFLDRDGTNVEKNYVHRVEDFEFLLGAVAAMMCLARAGIDIIVVTNQSGIAQGLAAVNGYMTAELRRSQVQLAGIYVCPHHPQAALPRYRIACNCRKPSPGLLLTAMHERGIAASEAVMIGDKNSDIEAGRAAGLITYLVQRDIMQTRSVQLMLPISCRIYRVRLITSSRSITSWRLATKNAILPNRQRRGPLQFNVSVNRWGLATFGSSPFGYYPAAIGRSL
jgi:D-glycero-D-manno-heptose 1,7-bisphosphate phosphatase